MNTFFLGLRYFFIDLVGGIVRWPFWWYTRGLGVMVRWCVHTVQGYSKMLAIRIWIKNIFVPMFGMYDWQSRLISFFMRVVQIIGRSFALMVLVFITLLALVFYVLIFPTAVGFAVYHLLGAIVV